MSGHVTPELAAAAALSGMTEAAEPEQSHSTYPSV